MRREVELLEIFGYLGILGLFIGMVVLCFFWGVWEVKKPKDPGPLYIDLDRTTKKRARWTKVGVNGASACGMPVQSRQTSKPAESNEKAQHSSMETIRVRGDIRVSKGEVIPYNMIVEGDLVSQEDVTFQGGLHVKGRVVIGARNRLEKSIVCQKELFLSEGVVVYNCVDCEGLVFVKSGVRVGVGEEGGGIASAGIVYLEKAEGPLTIHSEEGVRVVGVLTEVIPEDLRQIVGVKTK